MFEWLKRLFGSGSEGPPLEGPFEGDELPAGPLTGITSPLDPGGEPATAADEVEADRKEP